MDSHTEAILDLKPWLPTRYHFAFDAGVKPAWNAFLKAEEMFYNMMTDAPFNMGIELPSMERFHHGDFAATVAEYTRPYTLEERLATIDADGVAAEFLTPFLGAFSAERDTIFLHEMTLAYDRWFEEYTAPVSYRFQSATVANLMCGIEVVVDEIADAYAKGLRAISLPGRVKEHVSPELPYYNSHFYDPMWQALEDREMVAVFHVGLGREKPLLRWSGSDPGWELLYALDLVRTHQEALTYILAGGVLDRYPNLRIGYTESGSGWIGNLIAELDAYSAIMPLETSKKLDRLPSESWKAQGFAGGLMDRTTIDMRHALGVQTLMWGSDFPHVEGTYPHSTRQMAELFDGVPPDEVAAMVGGNAAAMLGFDMDLLARTPAAQVEWPTLA